MLCSRRGHAKLARATLLQPLESLMVLLVRDKVQLSIVLLATLRPPGYPPPSAAAYSQLPNYSQPLPQQ